MTMLKPLTMWDHNKLWKILEEMGIPDHPTCLLQSLYADQEATVRTDMEQRAGSKLEKEYIKAVYCHPAHLTYMQSTSCKNAKLDESQAGIKIGGRNINNLSYTDDTHSNSRKWRGTKELLMRVKEESEKAGLKLNI